VPAFTRALLVSRGVAGRYACAFLYDSVASIHALEVPGRKQPAVLLSALEASPDDHFSAIGSRFKIRWDDRFYSTSPSKILHVGGTQVRLAVSREMAFTKGGMSKIYA
jgi:hypothetical protein